jgi:hypothetical protein
VTRASLEKAREFLWGHARLVDRRAFERAFEGGSAEAVVRALRAYANLDGGFGHALEPDLRAPTSQPIFVDASLAILHEAGARDEAMVRGACEFLATVSREDGSVPYALPDAMHHPRADHWNGSYALEPSLLATSGVAARLHALAARHAWLDRATAWCFERIEGNPEYSPHRILNAMEFLRHAPDRERAAAGWKRVATRLFEDDYVAMATPITTYGLSPLRFAPTPDAPARALFRDEDLGRHLDHLEEQQREDGGWPILWDPPPGSARDEWRGRWTLDALLALRAYGRI